MNPGFGLSSSRFRSTKYRWRQTRWELVLEGRFSNAECLIIGHVYILSLNFSIEETQQLLFKVLCVTYSVAASRKIQTQFLPLHCQNPDAVTSAAKQLIVL